MSQISKENIESISVTYRDGSDGGAVIVRAAVRIHSEDAPMAGFDVDSEATEYFESPERIGEATRKAAKRALAALEEPLSFKYDADTSKPAPVNKPAVPSDFDHGKEGDPQALWEARLRHLKDQDREIVDRLEQRLIVLVGGRPLKRRLRGGSGWEIGKVYVSVGEVLGVGEEGFDELIQWLIPDTNFLDRARAM